MRIRWVTAVIASFLLVASSCGGEDGPASAAADASPGTPEGSSGAGTDGAIGEDAPVSPPIPDASARDATPDAQPACAGKTGTAGDRTVTIDSGGVARTFNLHVPAAYDPTKRTPLVLLFHGYTMSAATFAATTHFAATADARGMIGVFPIGIGTSFNGGECCGPASETNVDDVGFTRDMIAALEAEYCIDEKRVSATGISNGGFFVYRLACELADKIAAIAPVAGVIGMPPESCNPARPVPVLHIHGTGDVQIPYEGSAGAFRSVAVTVGAFRTKNACAAGNGTVVYQNGDVSCTKWGGCTANADVELCTVTGGGHQWPGGEPLPYGGSPTPNLIASDAIADFFLAHPMP
ncbi:MAG TPA: PHB depolymerase family esterase [Labilithrix sp.]|nr:PHB depolymerase family esterase [Labilithrix sp.]